jgi:hypothetical protein
MRISYSKVYVGEGRSRAEHVVIAEKVIGRPLPKPACVHHVDGNPRTNDHNNLVVCPSQAYHKLLHRRQDALAACGNADWLKCRICKTYDAPSALVVKPRGDKSPAAWHAACSREYERRRALKLRPEGWVWVPGSQNVGRVNRQHLEKLRALHTGRKRSPETIERMRQAALKREAAKRAV